MVKLFTERALRSANRGRSMKIKEVCTKTGLTQKAVRYYVENELCSPQEYESRGRKYLNFTEENLSELRDIAVMRKLGFSIEDIRIMKTDGGSIEDVMSRYIRSLSEELDKKKKIFSALAFRDYSDMHSLDELVPTLSGVLKPEPAVPDFSKFERELFDDGRDSEFSDLGAEPSKLAKAQEVFITYAAVIGTLMALTTLPGILLFLITALVYRKVRTDYVTLYELLSGIGFVANIVAFFRSAESIGGIAHLSEIFSGSVLGFATVQCGLYLLAAAAEFISLLILFFGREIKDYLYSQR